VKINILLVEDDSEVRAVLTELLVLDEIYTVETANGFEAWEHLTDRPDRERIHLVLSDVAMPKMNGFQLLDQLRSDGRFAKIPIILTSGNADRAKADLKAGAARSEPNAFFAKPFDFEKLAEIVKSLAGTGF
jgi:two-component system CheB/CheR fusion protein